MAKTINKDKLDRSATNYCRAICNRQVLQLRKDRKTGKLIWDFPAIAVACCSSDSTIYTDYSRGVREQHIYEPLKSALKSIGEIGKSSHLSNNKLGRCAEQHAANQLFRQFPKKLLTDVYFSAAYRPKTLQIFNYCENCNRLFSNLK